jgi:hypothetical protein
MTEECVHSYLSAFILSENLMVSIFHIVQTAHHTPASMYYVPAAEIFFLGLDSPSASRPSV